MKRILSPLLAALIFFTAVLPAAAATNTHDAIATTHVVQHGDTLYSIARQYGTSVDALMAMNGLTTNVIWVGQVLQIGSSSPSSPTNSYYTVVRGDTLYSIARRYGTTVEAIMKANHLTDTNIYVGQRLLIVTSSVPPIGNQSSESPVQYLHLCRPAPDHRFNQNTCGSNRHSTDGDAYINSNTDSNTDTNTYADSRTLDPHDDTTALRSELSGFLLAARYS